MTERKDIEDREPSLARIVNLWPNEKEISVLWSLIEAAYTKGFEFGWKSGVRFSCEEFEKGVQKAKESKS